MRKDSRILVLDDNAITRNIYDSLIEKGYSNTVMINEEINLLDKKDVDEYFDKVKPEYIFCFAGPHGGIVANINHSAEFIYKNLIISANIIDSAYHKNVKRMLYFTGACVYPRDADQPMKEESFLTGKMESTSSAYSMAKAAGIEMCKAYNKQYKTQFIPCIICNDYGIYDNFGENGHVLANMITKLICAKENGDNSVTFFGTGEPTREFMFSKDVANAAICIMNNMSNINLINIAGGEEVSIHELAEIIAEEVGYEGNIIFDKSKPDGTMRKVCDSTQIKALGFKKKYCLREGIRETINWYYENERT